MLKGIFQHTPGLDVTLHARRKKRLARADLTGIVLQHHSVRRGRVSDKQQLFSTGCGRQHSGNPGRSDHAHRHRVLGPGQWSSMLDCVLDPEVTVF